MQDFEQLVKRARQGQEEAAKQGNHHGGDVTNASLLFPIELKAWKNTNFTDQLDRGSLIFTRSAVKPSVLTAKFEKNRNPSIVDALNMSHLNSELHDLAYNYNKPNATGATVDTPEEFCKKLWKYAKEWYPVGICNTPCKSDMDIPTDKNRVLSIHVRGPTDVDNLWGAKVKSGDTCIVVLKWVVCKPNTQTMYIFSNVEAKTIEPLPDAYIYLKFVAAFYDLSSPDLLENKTLELEALEKTKWEGLGKQVIWYRIGEAMNHALTNRFFSPYEEEENDDLRIAKHRPLLTLMID